MKKTILCVLVLILIIFTASYNKVIKVDDIIKPYSLENLPDKMETYIYFSSYSNKELDVTGNESKKEIINLLSNIKVKKVLFSPTTYNPKLKETYQIFLSNNENEINSIYVSIFNDKYIRINDKIYKILSNPDLSSIYNIIILDQPKGLIDEFYYNLMH